MSRVEVIPIVGIPEVTKGSDLAGLILRAVKRQGEEFREKDVLVVKQKVVSKSEGMVVRLDEVEPSRRAKLLGKQQKKDPRLVELILRDAARIVRAGHGVIITETRHGFVCANSGVDQSNVGVGLAALLPIDPDRSARRIRKRVESASGVRVAVVVTDTFGRPWRKGQTDVAIGCSGIDPLLHYGGRKDSFGYELRVTEPAVVDEIAGAAELIVGKLEKIPASIVRGVRHKGGEGGVKSMILSREMDLFR